MVILILIAFIIISMGVDAAIKYSRQRKLKVPALSTTPFKVFNENTISIPKGIYFDKTHTWAFMEKSGMVKIGLDDFLLHITGNLNKLNLKNSGDRVQKGEALLSINQNGKQLTIYSPISGTVKYQNDELIKNPSLVYASPFNEGWLYMIEPSNWLRENQFMFMADKYMEWLNFEFSRVKDFLSTIGQINNLEPSLIILQDGGELKDNVLEDFGPEVWDDFQTKFINISK
ncbi:MAG: glycine cleavage system protein H [Bacteroidota bacterium]